MPRRQHFVGACLALLPLASQAAHVLLVDGVQGPSTRPNYAGWFDATSVNWSIDRQSATAPQVFDVVLPATATTATLGQLSANGSLVKRIAVDTVFSIDGGSALKLHWRLICEDAVIRQFASSASGNQPFTVALKIQCGKLTWEGFDYIHDTLAKSAKGSWNFKANTP